MFCLQKEWSKNESSGSDKQHEIDQTHLADVNAVVATDRARGRVEGVGLIERIAFENFESS